MNFHPSTIYGVDFSGAKLAGDNIWIARVEVSAKLKLVELSNLAVLANTAEREPALSHLVKLIRESTDALWAIDFPFGLPIEIMDADLPWPEQLDLVHSWKFGATEFGRWCVARAKKLGDRMHIRRVTDSETSTPFDCYHYRIIYQTFHGMRDVLRPLLNTPGIVIAPFQKLNRTRRVIIEACPGSTLKRLKLPHQNYKQPAGGPLTARRCRTRGIILDALEEHVEISPADRRRMMRNPGGDSMDAVIAAVGGYFGWTNADHKAIARHARYSMEGYVYCG
jgi:hypothetical protein